PRPGAIEVVEEGGTTSHVNDSSGHIHLAASTRSARALDKPSSRLARNPPIAGNSTLWLETRWRPRELFACAQVSETTPSPGRRRSSGERQEALRRSAVVASDRG